MQKKVYTQITATMWDWDDHETVGVPAPQPPAEN